MPLRIKVHFSKASSQSRKWRLVFLYVFSLVSVYILGIVINALAPHIPTMIGGSADLTGSNKTAINGTTDIQKDDFSGRYIRYGVREHGMGAIMNGLLLHGGFRPFGGTFLVFTDYCRPAIRLSALMKQRVVYVMTHDSIGLGEDGPTHQPVEQLASLRAMPGLCLIRPADANETAEACQDCLSGRIHSIGRQIGSGRGDSPNYQQRGG